MVSPSASASASPGPEQSTSRPSYPGVTSPAIQAHIHDLAGSALPPPRKQNQACDACRTRKVKCQQMPGQDKCQHCAAKNYPCTHYVQQATSEKKRSMAASRRPRVTTSAPPNDSTSLTSPHSLHPTMSLNQGPLTSLYQHTPHLSTAHQNSTAHLIAYLFSADETAPLPGSIGSAIGAGYRSYFRPPSSGTAPTSPDWADFHRKLADEPARFEFALDLVEVYFQICHMRMPLLDPDQIRSRLRHSLNPLASTPSGVPSSSSSSSPSLRPLPPALLATLVAWGAKFSEHPILVQDRKTSPGGRSRIAKLLLHRAREVAEGEKVHRVPTPDNVVISMLMEPLQSQSLTDPDGFKGFWINCGIRHLFELQINHRSTAESLLREERDMMTFAWWMSCLTDAFGSAFFRRKPTIEDDDYNFEMDTTNVVPVAPLSTSSSKTSPATTQAEFVTMWNALHDMARLARNMSKLLWRPITAEEGIPFETLRTICASLTQWRDKHLSRVGVPTNFEAEWDFVAAVSACSSDAQYHVMWIIMFNALDEFGLKESNDMARAQDQGTTPPVTMTRQETEAVDGIKTQVMDEALHGALRIAALAGVLTTNGYLRLDPNVLHYSIYAAGILLARLGRPEVSNCISGLQQYGFAYEEALDQAAEMNQVYQAAAPQAHSGVDHAGGGAGGGGGGFQAPPPPPPPPSSVSVASSLPPPTTATPSPHPHHVASPPAAGYSGAPESADSFMYQQSPQSQPTSVSTGNGTDQHPDQAGFGYQR